MLYRSRRLRSSQSIRKLVRETRLSSQALMWPLFLKEGSNLCQEIPSLPGQFHYSPDQVFRAIDEGLAHGVDKFLLFGLPDHKDEVGTQAYAVEGIVQQGLRAIKEQYGDQVMLVTDICMCEYTSHGHCGILKDGRVDNDKTLEYLADIAVSHAKAGADMVAPSDMMDGRVLAIRTALDNHGFDHLPILSYAVKYASSFYGPFRDAAGSAPSFGDRKGYQMDYHNCKEALKEAQQDTQAGADMLMVKPALAYLDVIRTVAEQTNLPLAAYSVSGEYAMTKAAAAQGLIDEYSVMCESAVAVFRAGADVLISYYANQIADAIRKGDIG